MLIKPLEHLKKTDPLRRPYKGVVVDNLDPRRLGRVKCVVPTLFEGEPETLPWIYPWTPAGLGGRGDSSGFVVPYVGAELIVEFPYNDLYSPFYTGLWQSESTHNGGTNEDYPNTYGQRDSQGTGFRVNQAKQLAEFTHASGSRVQFLKDGTIEAMSKKGIRFISEDGKTELYFDLQDGRISFDAKQLFALGGTRALLNPKQLDLTPSELNERVTGAHRSQVMGGRVEAVGGSYSLSVVGNRASSVGGNTSDLIAGTSEATYGLERKETVALGNMELDLIAGDRKVTITLGNYKTLLTAGDYDISVVAGNVKLNTAAGSVELSNALGKFTVSASGDIEASNALGKFTVSASGDIEISNALGQVTLSSSGDLKLSNTATGGLSIDSTGKVALGNGTTELIDQVIQTIDAILPANQPNLCMTSVGPSGPLLPPAAVSLGLIKTLLTSLKGSL